MFVSISERKQPFRRSCYVLAYPRQVLGFYEKNHRYYDNKTVRHYNNYFSLSNFITWPNHIKLYFLLPSSLILSAVYTMVSYFPIKMLVLCLFNYKYFHKKIKRSTWTSTCDRSAFFRMDWGIVKQACINTLLLKLLLMKFTCYRFCWWGDVCLESPLITTRPQVIIIMISWLKIVEMNDKVSSHSNPWDLTLVLIKHLRAVHIFPQASASI